MLKKIVEDTAVELLRIAATELLLLLLLWVATLAKRNSYTQAL